MRPLLQVRSKGRPQIEGPESKNHRIAVFAEEVELPSCKSTPLIILKASGKQIIDLRNGQIVGPYEENPSSQPVIKSNSFVHVNACCSMGVSKVRKRCMCNHKKVSKSEILNSYLTRKKLNSRPNGPLMPEHKSCCSSKSETSPPPLLLTAVKQEPELSWPTASQHPQYSDQDSRLQNSPETSYGGASTHPVSKPLVVNGRNSFEVIPVPSCLAPGTCSCSSNCACPGCVTHDNAPKSENLLFLNNDAQYDSELILTLQLADKPGLVPVSVPAHSTDSSAHLGAISGLNGASPPAPTDQGISKNGYLAFLQLILNEQLLTPPPNPPAMDSCSCPDDSCFCTNCEVHGIIEGYRLDDIFASYGSFPALPASTANGSFK